MEKKNAKNKSKKKSKTILNENLAKSLEESRSIGLKTYQGYSFERQRNKFEIREILIKKYHFKEFEAQALSDFLLPMLEFYPERRASARDLLRHPWLSMPPNYDYLMSETEIFRMNMKENLLGISEYSTKDKKEEDDNRDVYSSDSELNEADCEDNAKNIKVQDDTENDDEIQLGDTNPDKINIPNYNNSFCMYGQFVDLTSLDQPNPQFDKIIDKDLL